MDPYEILGIQKNADKNAVDLAYKQKLQEINNNEFLSEEEKANKTDSLNRAYDALMFGTEGEFYASSSSFSDVREKLDSGRIEDAETLLDGVPVDLRNAEWYYLKGRALHERGWLEQASENYARAVSMNPDNEEYQRAYNDILNKRRGRFRDEEYSGSSSGPCSGCCSTCAALACCDCLCSLCR